MTYRGVTWDHPRGRDALEAAAALAASRGGVEIVWDARTLEQFEAQSVSQIADSYDLVVLDHPHLGEAIREGALLPLDDVLPSELLDDLRAHSVGPTFTSYIMEGRLWAVPLDAATQVAASLTALVPDVPSTWQEVLELASRQPVALSLAGPHAFLTFASVCAAFGEPVGSSEGELVSPTTAAAVIDLLGEIALQAPSDAHLLNPIRMLERMSTVGDISYVPLIYGYVNYSSQALSFSNPPTRSPGSGYGSIVGGTGLALTKRCVITDDLVAHIAWLMSDEVQRRFIPLNQGQPSRREAWLDPVVDDASHGFYSGTLLTMEGSTVRPRYDGFISFQAEGSAIIRAVLLDRVGVRSGTQQLQEAYTESLATHGRKQ